MFRLFRRHLKACPNSSREDSKCSCPVWVDYFDDHGKRIRKTMNTRSWATATRDLARLEDPNYGRVPCAQPGCSEKVDRGRCARHLREVSNAIESFHDVHQDVAEETKRSRRRALRYFQAYLGSRDVKTVDQIDLEIVNAYRSTRSIQASTWSRELEMIRYFLRFCVDSEWILRNPAEKVKMPKNVKLAERKPYTPNEIVRIVAACDVIGRRPYERLRAHAMVLLLRYTGLRISDVATLERRRIRDGEILLRTAKNGKPVKLPVHPELQAALEILPHPAGADGEECAYFFWSGKGSRRAWIRDVSRTMKTVFETSGVASAHSHRFRHTIATEVLELGGSIEEAADILGDSPAIIRKHYIKWSEARQARISDLLARVWHARKQGVQVIDDEGGILVDGVGLEPTTPALRTRCSPN